MPADRSGGHSANDHPAGPSSVASSSSKRPYAKVNRSLRACDVCHSRKTRCSGQIPCKFCISRGIECKMSDDTIRIGNSKSATSKTGTSRSQERASLHYSIEQRHAQKSTSPAAQGPVPLGSITGQSYPGHLAPVSQPGFQYHQHQPHASTSGSAYYARPSSAQDRSPPSRAESQTQSQSPPKTSALPALPALPIPIPQRPLSSMQHHHIQPTQQTRSSQEMYRTRSHGSQSYERGHMESNALPTQLPPPLHQKGSCSPPGVTALPVSAGVPAYANVELENYDGDTIFNYFQERNIRPIVEADITSMIPRLSSNRYLDLYFAEAECIYQLWPVPSIIQHCHDTIWGDASSLEHTTHPSTIPTGLRSTLSAALAFGALLDRNVAESEALYHAAKSHYLEIVDAAHAPAPSSSSSEGGVLLAMNLEAIQLALQLAVFEVNTRRAGAACNSIAIAIRLAQSLGLHRKSSLDGCSPEEAMRRSQLWYCCVIQDAWLSMSTGRPPVVNFADTDLDSPWLDFPPEQTPTFTSPFFVMSIRLARIWHDMHAKLFRYRDTPEAEKQWIECLTGLDTGLRLWQRDIHQMYTKLGPRLNRAERLHCQAILLTFTPMRLAMHRTYLRMSISDDQQHEMLQRVMSQNTVIETALDIAAYTKASMQLGMRTCFSFLGTSLHLACLGLWEYLQQKPTTGHASDITRSETGLDNALWMIEHIAQGGENPAMSDVFLAVGVMRKVSERIKADASPALPAPSVPYPNQGQNGYVPRHINYRRLEGVQQASSAAYHYDQGVSASSYVPASTSMQLYEERRGDPYPQSHHRTVWPADAGNSAQRSFQEAASALYTRMPARDLQRYPQ